MLPVLEVRCQILRKEVRFWTQAAQLRSLCSWPHCSAAELRGVDKDGWGYLLFCKNLNNLCKHFIALTLLQKSWSPLRVVGPVSTYLLCPLQESAWPSWRCSASGCGCSTGTALGPHHLPCRPTGDRWALGRPHASCPSAAPSTEDCLAGTLVVFRVSVCKAV